MDGLKRRGRQKTPKLLELCPTEGDKAWLGRVSFLVDFASGFFVSFGFFLLFCFFPFFNALVPRSFYIQYIQYILLEARRKNVTVGFFFFF